MITLTTITHVLIDYNMNKINIKYILFILILSFVSLSCEQNDDDYDRKSIVGQDIYLSVKDVTTDAIYMLDLMQRVDAHLTTSSTDRVITKNELLSGHEVIRNEDKIYLIDKDSEDSKGLCIERVGGKSIFSDFASWEISRIKKIDYRSEEYIKYGIITINSLGDNRWSVIIEGDNTASSSTSVIEILTSKQLNTNTITNSYQLLKGSNGATSQQNNIKGISSTSTSYVVEEDLIFVTTTNGTLSLFAGKASLNVKTDDSTEQSYSTLEVLDDYIVEINYQGATTQWWDVY